MCWKELQTPDGLDAFRQALEALLAASGCPGLNKVATRSVFGSVEH